jgi:hypothetical protein
LNKIPLPVCLITIAAASLVKLKDTFSFKIIWYAKNIYRFRSRWFPSHFKIEEEEEEEEEEALSFVRTHLGFLAFMSPRRTIGGLWKKYGFISL